MGGPDSTAVTPLGLSSSSVVDVNKQEVVELLAVTHGIIMPVLIVCGVLINGFCYVVADRPSLKKWHFNKYVKLLALIDMLGCLFSAPAVICQRICYFSSYIVAFYYTHLGWTLVLLLRTISVITILWMSYDRFVSIWNFERFQNATKPKIFYYRCIFTVLVSITLSLPSMVSGKVEEAECEECDDEFDDDIELWMSKEAPSIHGEDLWFQVYLKLILVGHCASLFSMVALSIGLVVGLIKKRKQNKSLKKRRQFNQTITILIINTSYALLNIPFMLVITRFEGLKESKVHCTYEIRIERLAAIGTCFLMIWHTVNTLIIFTVNKDYKNEVKSVLRIIPCFKNYCFVSRRDKRNDSNLENTVEVTMRHSMPLCLTPALSESAVTPLRTPLRAQSSFC